MFPNKRKDRFRVTGGGVASEDKGWSCYISPGAGRRSRLLTVYSAPCLAALPRSDQSELSDFRYSDYIFSSSIKSFSPSLHLGLLLCETLNKGFTLRWAFLYAFRINDDQLFSQKWVSDDNLIFLAMLSSGLGTEDILCLCLRFIDRRNINRKFEITRTEAAQ